MDVCLGASESVSQSVSQQDVDFLIQRACRPFNYVDVKNVKLSNREKLNWLAGVLL
jgi:DNA-binding sugar fermentation-stimulating protein